MLKEFLVEIRVKDWIHVPKSISRTVTYVEVLAVDEVYARSVGFDEFAKRSKYEPITRRLMETRGLQLEDCCAPDSVEI